MREYTDRPIDFAIPSLLKLGSHVSFQCEKGESRSVIGRGLREVEIADDDGFSAAVFAEQGLRAWAPA